MRTPFINEANTFGGTTFSESSVTTRWSLEGADVNGFFKYVMLTVFVDSLRAHRAADDQQREEYGKGAE